MSKYVHGRVRLATASPRINLYDYGTKSYTPPDYYGDHFMYRDDPNLLPVRQGLYASYSPTPSQNQLTAYPPQTLYSNHSSSYSQGWNPTMSGCSCANMGYLGSGDVDDLAILNDIEAGDVESAEESGSWWQGIKDFWDGLSEEDKNTIKNTAKDAVNEAIKSGDSGSGQGAIGTGQLSIRLSQMSYEQLVQAYDLVKRLNLLPYLKQSMLRKIRMEMIGRIFKQHSIQSGKSGAWKTPSSPLKPSYTSSQGNGQGNGQEDKKGGAGGLILGAGALFLLAKALL